MCKNHPVNLYVRSLISGTSVLFLPRAASTSPRAARLKLLNVFFDVDGTIICSLDDSLRPLVRETFDRIRHDGHLIYVWSGLGLRWREIDMHGLRQHVTNCYVKPLSNHRRSLPLLGISVEPHFVVDDHKEVVDAFGGYTVRAYSGYDPSDREMAIVYDKVMEAAASHA